MSFTPPIPDPTPMREAWLLQGVLWRRVIAWLIDIAIQAPFYFLFFLAIIAFGFLTFGLGWSLLPGLVLFSFLYNILFIGGPLSATPGQAMMGLKVRREDDLGPPSMIQAIVFTAILYLTLTFTGLLLLVALVTNRHRTLHDFASGLVVVRSRALFVPAMAWPGP